MNIDVQIAYKLNTRAMSERDLDFKGKFEIGHLQIEKTALPTNTITEAA